MSRFEGASTATGSTDDLSTDRLFDLLANERRRYVVAYLQESSEPVSTQELSKRIADRESDAEAEPPARDVDAVHQSLYHAHLPKLAAADVIEHDSDEEVVERGPNFDRMLDMLPPVDG